MHAWLCKIDSMSIRVSFLVVLVRRGEGHQFRQREGCRGRRGAAASSEEAPRCHSAFALSLHPSRRRVSQKYTQAIKFGCLLDMFLVPRMCTLSMMQDQRSPSLSKQLNAPGDVAVPKEEKPALKKAKASSKAESSVPAQPSLPQTPQLAQPAPSVFQAPEAKSTFALFGNLDGLREEDAE